MKWYKADLHLHSVLSPCGDLESSPTNIVLAAKEKGLDIIGMTDHNTLRHAGLLKELAIKEGIYVLQGAEVTTQEEAHVLCFFEADEKVEEFQAYLNEHLPKVKNKPDLFGYQVVVDAEENILDQEEYLLISAINQTVEEIEAVVHGLDGIFIPAHIDRPSYSLISQLGIIPFGLNVDAVEISRNTTKEKILKQHKYLKNHTFIQSSDAHFPEHIAQIYSEFYIEEPTFEEIKKALRGEDERKVRLVGE